MNIKELNEQLDKFLLLEMAWKTGCGEELTAKNTQDISKQYKLPILSQFANLQQKASWLINYVDVVPRNKLQGFKINLGVIEYVNTINQQQENNNLILCVENCQKNTNILNRQGFGLDHMKYGDSKHWKDTKKAISNLIIDIQQKTYTYKPDTTRTDCIRLFSTDVKRKRANIRYVLGVPTGTDKELILITCFKQ